ncbi:MAG: YHYH protein [Planctomycetota bacterium]|nr:YHYH protein [Planctomycetota bacterium]
MNRTLIAILLALAPVATASAQTINPTVTAWQRNTTGATGYNGILADVTMVRYSANYVYPSSTCIPSYAIGPWPGNPNTPANQNYVFRIPRNPVASTGAGTATSLGHIGVLSNGVVFFNALDAFSYNNQNIWHRNAMVFEVGSMDACNGHPAPTGQYHPHSNPLCLSGSSLTTHSPIIGFGFDGYPIYGPYGYANADGSGGIVRIETSYRKRNITVRTSLPNGTQLPANQYGPAVSATYPLSSFVEDFEYAALLGDLDEDNGRFAVTPEYPNGTYAYYATIDAVGAVEYPYIIGPTYHGTVAPGNTGPGSGHVVPTDSPVTFTGFPCPADSTGDRVVDGVDLGALLSRWGQGGGAGDIDRNGLVDGADLALMLSDWGICN